MPFGDWLRRELEEREWSQGELARRLKSDTGLISMWVNNQRTPSRSSCRRIAEALNLPEQIVLDAAGRRVHSPEVPEGIDLQDPAINFVAHNIDQLSPEDRERLMRFMMELVEQRRKS